jgi:26S proteasome regulatory subunit N11
MFLDVETWYFLSCLLTWIGWLHYLFLYYYPILGRAGVPMEVMGLMLGEFVDDYTIRVIDVFAMPQSGTGVSVEAVDPVFQTHMLDMLKQTGRSEMVVGWYHSHPGFGCWLSSVDMNTQQVASLLS